MEVTSLTLTSSSYVMGFVFDSYLGVCLKTPVRLVWDVSSMPESLGKCPIGIPGFWESLPCFGSPNFLLHLKESQFSKWMWVVWWDFGKRNVHKWPKCDVRRSTGNWGSETWRTPSFSDPKDVSCERLDKAGWFERILQKLRNGFQRCRFHPRWVFHFASRLFSEV